MFGEGNTVSLVKVVEDARVSTSHKSNKLTLTLILTLIVSRTGSHTEEKES